QAVIEACEQPHSFEAVYADDDDLQTKIEKITKKIYHGATVEYGPKAKRQLREFAAHGWDHLPVCMAKTQYSFTDNAKLLGAPTDFTLHVREFMPKLGAGFIVALTGNVLTMPGLPKVPAANGIDVDNNGRISGLY
ncbi:MAG: formate--tetrahydrofolate ligase, partial [Firmicutes bacterium]|nr:formate--tetrahydrofolate ligase [Candidatus Gallilactobacillus intestinavium]